MLKHLHMGTEKMLLLARSSLFWPELTNDVKNIAKSCEPCQKHSPKQRQEEIFVVNFGKWLVYAVFLHLLTHQREFYNMY